MSSTGATQKRSHDTAQLGTQSNGRLRLGTAPFRADKLTPPTTYDIPLIRAYWKQRPLAANKRSSRLLAKLVSWGSKVVLDVQAGRVDKNAPKRAAELRQLITDQGPAFVKVSGVSFGECDPWRPPIHQCSTTAPRHTSVLPPGDQTGAVHQEICTRVSKF
jgi:hypothetical protein